MGTDPGHGRYRQKPSVSHRKGHTMIPVFRCLSQRIVRTFFLQALFIPAVQSAYCLFGPLHPYPEFLPHKIHCLQYGCVGIPFTASGSPCFGNSPKASGGHLIAKPPLFPLKGEAPVIRLTKIPVLTAAPQVPHKPQIPPGTCAPLFLISSRAASKSSSPPAFL